MTALIENVVSDTPEYNYGMYPLDIQFLADSDDMMDFDNVSNDILRQIEIDSGSVQAFGPFDTAQEAMKKKKEITRNPEGFLGYEVVE